MATSADSARPLTADSLSQSFLPDHPFPTGSHPHIFGSRVPGWCLVDRYGRKHAIQSNYLLLGRENCDIMLKVYMYIS